MISGEEVFFNKGKKIDFQIDDLSGFLCVHPDQVHEGAKYASFFLKKEFSHTEESQQFLELAKKIAIENQCQWIIGPIFKKTVYGYRYQLTHFEDPVFWGEPQNDQAQVEMIKDLGFELVQEYVSETLGDMDKIRKVGDKRLPRTYREIKDDYGFLKLNLETWNQHKSSLLGLVNKIFQENPAFLTITKEDFDQIYSNKVIFSCCQKTSFLYQHKESGEVVGGNFAFQNPSNPKQVLIKTIGITEEHRKSGKTFLHCLHYIFNESVGYDELMFCLMKKGNSVQNLSSKWSKRQKFYGLFGYRI